MSSGDKFDSDGSAETNSNDKTKIEHNKCDESLSDESLSSHINLNPNVPNDEAPTSFSNVSDNVLNAVNDIPLTVDNQISLEGILGLVDDVESQVESYRTKVKDLEKEKASLQKTVSFIKQLLSQRASSNVPTDETSNLAGLPHVQGTSIF